MFYREWDHTVLAMIGRLFVKGIRLWFTIAYQNQIKHQLCMRWHHAEPASVLHSSGVNHRWYSAAFFMWFDFDTKQKLMTKENMLLVSWDWPIHHKTFLFISCQTLHLISLAKHYNWHKIKKKHTKVSWVNMISFDLEHIFMDSILCSCGLLKCIYLFIFCWKGVCRALWVEYVEP